MGSSLSFNTLTPFTFASIPPLPYIIEGLDGLLQTFQYWSHFFNLHLQFPCCCLCCIQTSVHLVDVMTSEVAWCLYFFAGGLVVWTIVHQDQLCCIISAVLGCHLENTMWLPCRWVLGCTTQHIMASEIKWYRQNTVESRISIITR